MGLSLYFGLKVFMDARMPVTHKEGDRYPLRPPRFRGCSSAGRATALQAEGQRFDPVLLHQQKNCYAH